MGTISGLHPTACSLAPSGFGLPLPSLPADFATDLLATLWSGGTLTVCDHPLGNIIEFHEPKSIPIDLGLTRRDYMSCLFPQFYITTNLLQIISPNLQLVVVIVETDG